MALAAETDPDVIVMDLAMPLLDGLAAAQALAAAGARARVLVLTLSEGDANVFAAVWAGATGYLVKGVAAAHVVGAVEAVAAGRAVFGPGPATRMLDLLTRHPAAGRFPVSAREQEVLEQLTAGRSNQVANRREAMLRHHDR